MSVIAGERDKNIAETYVPVENLPQTIQRLLANEFLMDVRIIGFKLSEEDLQTVAYALTENKHLRALSLDHLRIGDAGAKHIAQGVCYNKSLTFLSLRWNEIGNEGGSALADALHYNQTLKHLLLSFNKLGRAAGKSFANALLTNTALCSLDLKWNKIDDEAGDALLDVMGNTKGNLNTLLLGGNGSSLRNTRKDNNQSKNSGTIRSKSMRFLSSRKDKKSEDTTVSLDSLRRDMVQVGFTEEEPEPEQKRDFQVGDVVEVSGDIGSSVRKGTIRFLGQTQFAGGIWVGVEFEGPVGKNNGTVDGVQYFSCPTNHGSFLRTDKLAFAS